MTRILSAVSLAGIATTLPLIALAAPTISDLTVIPIPSWGLAINYSVSGATPDDADAPLVVTATGVGTNYTATTLYGDTACANGSHYVFWQTSKDGITADVSNGTVRVWHPLRYCVIDLDTGASSAVNAEPAGGFNTDEYKTSKLVLKRVSDTDPFYMGLFEVTIGQWSRVLAANPDFSYSASDLASSEPVSSVSYVDICGEGVSYSTQGDPVLHSSYSQSEIAKYEAALEAIANAKAELERLKQNSFLVRLADLTGQSLALPTVSQWERACQADGASAVATDDSAWHSGNADGSAHPVGQKTPNVWGLYDILGNAWEWCRDLKESEWVSAGTTASGSVFSASLCGGSWQKSAEDCASTSQTQSETSTRKTDYGFRLVRNAAEMLSAIDCFAAISNVSWKSVSVDVDATAESSQAAAELAPVVAGDTASAKASVTGDAESGFVVTPSEDATAVVVTIPSGVDAAKVTIEVSPETKTVMSNGAQVRVVRNGTDITDCLDIPSAVGGVIDLSAATVKEEIAKESLDAAKGAKVDFSSPSKPSLTTAPTRAGLVYRLKEGATLEAMAADEPTSDKTKVGDGSPWKPTLSVTGGASGFYTIEVGK